MAGRASDRASAALANTTSGASASRTSANAGPAERLDHGDRGDVDADPPATAPDPADRIDRRRAGRLGAQRVRRDVQPAEPVEPSRRRSPRARRPRRGRGTSSARRPARPARRRCRCGRPAAPARRHRRPASAATSCSPSASSPTRPMNRTATAEPRRGGGDVGRAAAAPPLDPRRRVRAPGRRPGRVDHDVLEKVADRRRALESFVSRAGATVSCSGSGNRRGAIGGSAA